MWRKRWPAARSVDGGGLVEFGVDGVQSDQEQQHVEGHADPDVGEDHPRHRGGRVGEPVVGETAQADCLEQGVVGAGLRVQHPAEEGAADHRRQQPGDQQEGAQQAVEGERAGEEQSQGEADRELEQQRAEGEDQGEAHGVPEGRVVGHGPVVVQSVEPLGPTEELAQVDVVDGRPHVVEQRVGQEEGEEGHARQAEEVAGAAAARGGLVHCALRALSIFTAAVLAAADGDADPVSTACSASAMA